jgi:hypothetical protein
MDAVQYTERCLVECLLYHGHMSTIWAKRDVVENVVVSFVLV